MIIKSIIYKIKSRGIGDVLASIQRRIFPKKAMCFQLSEEFVANKIGLEVGGPSSVFEKSGILPIYPIVKQLDNCNFSGTTTWEGSINEGLNFNFDLNLPPGQQYVAEATDLSKIDSAKYDFILSSHMLEHTANPLRALSEWTRVLKEVGFLVIILPHKDGTFDRQRPVTTLEHIIEDFEGETQEDDLTHLPEILKFHDLQRDLEAETLASFQARSEKNFENRCLHQHVFDTNLTVQLLNHQHLKIHAVEAILPCHIVTIAQKQSNDKKLDNERFLKDTAEYKLSSPFSSDRSRSI